MSSEEKDTLDRIPAPSKKRRIQRACDICRQKRRACDGLRTSTKKCTFCIENKLECVYSGAVTTTKRQSYTEILEARLALTEKLLRKARSYFSALSLNDVLTPPQLSAESGRSPKSSENSEWSKDSPVVQHTKAKPAITTSGMGPGVELAAMGIRTMNVSVPSRIEDDKAHRDLADDIEGLSLNNHNDRFHGKSSGAMLVKAAIQLKEGYTTMMMPDGQIPSQWGSRRMEYWSNTPWYQQPVPEPQYTFPPPDLLSNLVDLYFERNIFLPLLHRPTFMRALRDNLHLRDNNFAANVLLVCAIASRFSNDPRVYDPTTPLICGFKYFDQISTGLEHLFNPPTLYDLQRYCLAIQFLEGSAPQANWALIGIGIRIAQEAGAHRTQLGERHTVEAELWRRAFWTLISYDRLVSCTLGRPCAVQYDDFDIQLPTEVDDEYWEHEDPARAFRQPLNKPSKVAFFTAFLKLNNILSFSLRILYSLDKAKELLAVRDDAWEEHLVAELDSALNNWVDSIPEHLRWDANRADPVLFQQSVALYCGYYHVQMTTHRPFIPMIRQAAPTALPSLAICTNAARSCSHVADVWCRRMGDRPAIILLPALTTAGIVLLLNVWSGQRTGLAPHMNTAIAEVHKCMQAIRVCEQRWQMAGLFWDILNELATIGHVPLPTHTSQSTTLSPSTSVPPPPVNQHKRAHSGEHAAPFTRLLESPTAMGWADPLAQQLGLEEGPFTWLGTPKEGSALPMYGADLVRVQPQSAFTPYVNTSRPSTKQLGRPEWAELPNFMSSSSTTGVSQQYPVVASGDHRSEEDILSLMDNDTIAMWADAPTTLGVNDWGAYFDIMSQMNQTGPR
ncbi:fungal-specific transcription factor domain-containing protein [Mycena alexandri]|uniref:Fungal-specific transcription factor domain-containing protein n=1 Tax=Mycena alexandri TaxID=1745969 RepID=A0AAD6S8D6_9AGAR|nr:fungal-specific transcription factor domain-containing protein [Mycena alexandri]